MNTEAKSYWRDFTHVKDALAPVIQELGRMPTQKELAARGLLSLAYVIINHHNGFPAVQQRLGVAGIQRQNPPGFWMNFAHIEQALAPIVKDLGRMPKTGELYERGLGRVSQAIIAYHGGFLAVQKRLGLPGVVRQHPPGYWANFENVVRVLTPIIAVLGRVPTHQELVARKLAPVSKAIVNYHGGYAVVRVRLGCDPVTKEAIAVHADTLARVLPALGHSSDTIWPLMRRRWTQRQLLTAITSYETDGNTMLFERLLNGSSSKARQS